MVANLRGKRILVTGAQGYIGKHVVRALAPTGASIEMWDCKDPFKKTGVLKPDWTVDGHLDWWVGDLGYNKIDIADQYEQVQYYRDNKYFDVIIHLAAVASVPEAAANPDRAYDVNVSGTANMLNLAIKWGALFIHADTAMSPFASASVYANTKSIAKSMVEMQNNTVCLTLFNVAGASTDGKTGEAHDPETHFVPNLVRAAIEKSKFCLDGNPRVRRDFIHVEDVATAFRMVTEQYFANPEGFQPCTHQFHVGRGLEVSLEEIVKSAKDDLRWEFEVERVETDRFEPYDKGYTMVADRAKWVPGWFPYGGYMNMLTTQYQFAVKRLNYRLPETNG